MAQLAGYLVSESVLAPGLSGTTTHPMLPGYVAALNQGPFGGAYLMRAQDQGRAAGSNYTVWVSVNSDFAGVGYATGVPTPTGAMVVGSVVATRIE